MKTSLDFDTDEHKFQPKLSILELVFAETKQPIGHVEFDLGVYTNKIRDQLVKTVLDLKSDKFPGCQIYIYVNIQLLDPLPEKGAITKPIPSIPTNTNSTGAQSKIDINSQLFEIKKLKLVADLKELEEKKIKLEVEQERLKFQKTRAE